MFAGTPYTGAALGKDELKDEQKDKLTNNEFGKTKTKTNLIHKDEDEDGLINYLSKCQQHHTCFHNF